MPEAGSWWSSFSKGLLGFAYPDQCALCGQMGTPTICEACLSAFPEDHSGLQKLGRDDPLDGRIALFRYQDRARQAVQRLKYDRITALADPMALMMREGFIRYGLDDFDAIVPVPIHWSRRFQRGFNQSELLAKGLDQSKLYSKLLKRVRPTTAQVNLTPTQRRENIRDAFAATPTLSGKAVVLIDDVFTTGHTARECARELKGAGVSEVISLTFCVGG